MKLKIQEAAKLTGLSPKALRHYDKIGLLHPEELSDAGYRLYGPKELSRLREILLLRELDFSLKEIAQLLDVPDRNRQEALRRQRELLVEKRRHLDGVITLVDNLLKGEKYMDFEAFHTEELDAAREKYAREAKERWGETEAYRESRRREKSRSKEDEQAMLWEMDGLLDRFAAMADRNPADPEVQALVKEWKNHISRWHYDCSREILAGLGQMYTGDPRFAENLNAHGPGTAELMSKAIAVFCKEK